MYGCVLVDSRREIFMVNALRQVWAVGGVSGGKLRKANPRCGNRDLREELVLILDREPPIQVNLSTELLDRSFMHFSDVKLDAGKLCPVWE